MSAKLLTEGFGGSGLWVCESGLRLEPRNSVSGSRGCSVSVSRQHSMNASELEGCSYKLLSGGPRLLLASG